jgi:hypothetical protein
VVVVSTTFFFQHKASQVGLATQAMKRVQAHTASHTGREKASFFPSQDSVLDDISLFSLFTEASPILCYTYYTA